MAEQLGGLEGSQPEDLSKHPSEKVPTLQNIVSTVNLDCKLDLKKIALQARSAEYNPERFDAVVMRIREPKTTALFFASGKMVCTGAKSEQQSRYAARKFTQLIQRLGYPANFKDFKIQNTVGSCDAMFPIDLEGLAYSHGAFSSSRKPDREKTLTTARRLQLDPDVEGSGAQHFQSRYVNAFARRQQMQTVDVEKRSRTEEVFDDILMDDDLDSSEDSAPVHVSRRRKGSNGRFVAGSTSGSSRRVGTDADDVWTVNGPVPGGPLDGSVIPSFLGHIAFGIWKGDERGTLKCQSRLTACAKLRDWYKTTSDEVREMIDMTGLAHLPDTMFNHLDIPLLSAFVERWQPDTSSFHLPFGEMTITLHDVWHILRIPVEGDLISSNPGRLYLQVACVEILGISLEVLLAEGTKHLAQGGILIDSIISLCGPSQGRTAEVEAIAWIWLMLGCTLFVDKSGHRIRPACLWEVRDGLTDATSYSWGSATLAYLYRQLGVASRGDCLGLSGCLTLLQAWIYEYFPCFRPQRERLIISSETPRACSWSVSVSENTNSRLQALRVRIDQLTADEVTWLPFGADPAITIQRTAYMGWILYRDILEPYMPGRILRQFGYVQTIPPPIFRPVNAVRSWRSLRYTVEMAEIVASDSWRTFPFGYILPFTCLERATVIAGACVPEYMEWYVQYSHPQLLKLDVAAPRGVPSRSNSDYWVTCITSQYQRFLASVATFTAQHREHCTVGDISELEQLTSDALSELERFMAQWRMAD